jgi:ferritin
MLSKKMLKTLNEQIAKEWYSAYLYMQMAGYFENENLPGFAHWMRVQAQEELCHGLIFFNYICERDGLVELGPVESPNQKFASPLEAFEKTLEHEQKVTASIHNLVNIAIEEKDHASKNRLEWFVAEQVEEEANATTLIGKLKRLKKDSEAIFILDGEVAARAFALPEPLLGKMPAAGPVA